MQFVISNPQFVHTLQHIFVQCINFLFSPVFLLFELFAGLPHWFELIVEDANISNSFDSAISITYLLDQNTKSYANPSIYWIAIFGSGFVHIYVCICVDLYVCIV